MLVVMESWKKESGEKLVWVKHKIGGCEEQHIQLHGLQVCEDIGFFQQHIHLHGLQVCET